MFHTKRDFIDAMEANPDDVVLMAAFSDWLEENGDPMWEGMRLLADYRITGYSGGHYNIHCKEFQNIGSVWFHLNWDVCHKDRVSERLRLCQAFADCSDVKRSLIYKELTELYPISEAMRAAVDRSTPA